VKGFGIGIVRWLAGLVLGLASAALLFGLAARVESAPGASVTVGRLALLMGGFGIAFFPVVYSMGTRSPRSVIRRGVIGLAVEGLLTLLLVGFRLITNSSPIPSSWLTWLSTLGETTSGLARFFGDDVLIGVLGLLIFAVGILLFIVLRQRAATPRAVPATTATAPAGRADAPTTRAPVLDQVRQAPPATATPAETQPPAAATDDEDAKLMADLENLRKKLPTMGVDESGSGKRP
jgi:hypothetical protein